MTKSNSFTLARALALLLSCALALTSAHAEATQKAKKSKKKAKKGPTPQVRVVQNYANHPAALVFIDEMAREHGFERDSLQKLLAHAKKSERVIELMDAPIRRPAQWFEYSPRFLSEERINEGAAFMRTHADALKRAQEQYGVPAEIIAAIIGVETFYGRITGSFNVLDALATLAFDYPRRAEFFRGELKHFLLLNRNRPNVSLFAKGSYAGAMGLPQFMPGSYLNYAVDFDQDARIDLWNSAPDIIGSVANYFVKHGWKPGQPVWSEVPASEVSKLPAIDGGLSLRQPISAFRALGVPTAPEADEASEASVLMLEETDGPRYYMAYQNWYVITRYNRSRLYASAVWALAQAIRART